MSGIRIKPKPMDRLEDEKLAKVFRCSPDPVTISTLKEGRFIEVNESFLKMMGYQAKEEVIGRTSAELGIWPRPELRDELRRRLETAGVVRNLELEYRVRSGEIHVGLFSAELIELEGEPCILLAMKDVTEDRRVRAELQLFRQLLDHSHDAILIIDPATARFLAVNEAASRTLGYTREELLARGVMDIEAAVPSDLAWSDVMRRIREVQRLVAEGQHRRKDGTVFPVEVSITLVVQQGQEYLVAVARDITERKEAEARRRESEERFRKIFDHSNDAIFIVDPMRDEIIDANAEACRLLRCSREEFFSLPLSAFYPDEMEKFRALAQQVFAKGGGRCDELRCRTRTGEEVPTEISASAIELGGRRCLLALVRDIRERKRVEAMLRQTQIELERRVAERTAQLIESRRELERSRDDLLSLIDQLQWCSALTDPKGRITFLSPAAQRLFGIGLEKAVGRPWEEVFPFSLHDKAQIKALMERPLTERARLPLYVETAPAVC